MFVSRYLLILALATHIIFFRVPAILSEKENKLDLQPKKINAHTILEKIQKIKRKSAE